MHIASLYAAQNSDIAFKALPFKEYNFLKVLHKVPDVGTWYLNRHKYGVANPKLCVPCNFTIFNNISNSNRNDYLLTLMMRDVTGFIPLVRLLYTIRTKANKVFFIDYNTIENMNQHEKDVAANCGATIINLGFVRLPRFHSFYPFSRWAVYFDFLYTLKQPIYRIIIYDGQDTIFQGDPFFNDFLPDNLYITVEDRIINNSNWARTEYKECFGNITNDSPYWNSKMYNAGTVAGGYEPIIRLMYIFLRNIDLQNIYSIKGVDQAILTKLIVDGEFDNVTSNIKFLTIDDEFASISVGCLGPHCIKLYPKKSFRIGEYKSSTRNLTTLIVHQFERYNLFTQTYLKACPRNGASEKNYMRRIYNISNVEKQIEQGLI